MPDGHPNVDSESVLRSFTPEQRERLSLARVGIAGAGGLGSNAAIMLGRCGVGALVLVDGDCVEQSNLNRQHYMPRHVGQSKVEALAGQIHELGLEISVETHRLWLEEENIPLLLDKADIWLECLDDARTKALFVTHALKARKHVIAASGMGGFGGRRMVRRVMRTSNGIMAVVGDFCSDVDLLPPLAPRVLQCAAMQADAALELILTGNIEPLL